MQFGIFSVSDITRDPVTGYTPSEAERIDAIVISALSVDSSGPSENDPDRNTQSVSAFCRTEGRRYRRIGVGGSLR